MQAEDLVGHPGRLVVLVLGPVPDDRLTAVADRSKSALGLRDTLLAITALAASRMVWVERKFWSRVMVVASGKACSKSRMLRMSAPRNR